MSAASFQDIDDSPHNCLCPKCKKMHPRLWTVLRSAIDVGPNGRALLRIRIGVYHCSNCKIYYRFQPAYLKPRAHFTNRVMNIAVASAIEDGMPVSRVRSRLKRDFGICVAEGSIRSWLSKAAAVVNFSKGVSDPIILSEISGVLCVDETYSGSLAILVASDPLNKDRLVGYMVGDKGFTSDDVSRFLKALRSHGIQPAQVITDESSLYPKTIKEVWPDVCHQLCLFHMSQKIAQAAKKAVRRLKRSVPKKPKINMGRNYACQEKVSLVLDLKQQGYSLRKISTLVGAHRKSVTRWLRDPKFISKKYKISVSKEIDASKKTIATFNQENESPPDGWNSWEQIQKTRLAMSRLAFTISSRKNFDNERIQTDYKTVVDSPVGKQIQRIREVVGKWYKIWYNNDGTKVELIETAGANWKKMQELKLEPCCDEFKMFQKRMTQGLFDSLSSFLQDRKYKATSNSAERYARKIKKIQKHRYRIREKRHLFDYLLLSALASQRPMVYENLQGYHPYLPSLAL